VVRVSMFELRPRSGLFIIDIRAGRNSHMKDCKVRILFSLAILFLVLSALMLVTSPAEEWKDHPQSRELKFFPHTYDQCPELDSPMTMEDGTEIVVGITKENTFTLIPVTVEKKESLGYREEEWDNIRILEVDSEDFPTLARTGLHAELELDCTREITGRTVAEITNSGRPGASSGEGFMSREEDIISVLRGDNRLVSELGLTHPQLAKPLFHVWNIARWVSYASSRAGRSIDGIDQFLYNGRNVRLINAGGRGWQSSLFNDEIKGMYHLEFRRELDEEEKAFLHLKYPDLGGRQMTELIRRLTHIHTGEMVPFYIMRYGFYEGHTGYRADPVAVSFIFGLKSLDEIAKIFGAGLYQALTQHFTRENVSAGDTGL